jgi:PleD family two-component response regulator
VQDADFMRKAGTIAIDVTTSIGCAEYSTEVGTADDLLRSAEAALYEAKVRGKNTVRW